MSDSTPSPLEAFRAAVVAYLAAQSAVFAGVAILERQPGDVDSKLAEAFNSAGVFVEVWLVRAKAKRNQSAQIIYESVQFAVDVYENVPINQAPGGTGKGAWYLAESVLQYLKYAHLPDFMAGVQTGEIEPADGETIEDVSKDVDSGVLVLRVNLSTTIYLPLPPS